MLNPTVPANAISLPALFRRAHHDARSHPWVKKTYRERFRVAPDKRGAKLDTSWSTSLSLDT